MPPDPAPDSPVLFAYDGSDHAEPRVEVGAPIWASIVQVADDNDAAVVVLGSHGRSGVSYVAMGSVATAVAHHTKRPVLITPMA